MHAAHPERNVSDDKQLGLYEGQIWGMDFARQVALNLESGHWTPRQINQLIDRTQRELREGLSILRRELGRK